MDICGGSVIDTSFLYSRWPVLASRSSLPSTSPTVDAKTGDVNVAVSKGDLQQLIHTTLSQVAVGTHAIDLSTLELKLDPEPTATKTVIESRISRKKRAGGTFDCQDRMFRVGVTVTIVCAIIHKH